MKITKLVHSCLLVEKDGKKAIVDPGGFSWKSGLVVQNELKEIDYVLITHVHGDHLDESFANVIHELSPNAVWYSTQEVVEKLHDLGIKAYTTSKLTDVVLVPSEHADLSPWNTQPEHTSFVLFNELLVSGDCHTLSSMHGARILAGAVNGGPWGAIVGELKMIEAMPQRPEVLVPLHDWHWKEEAKESLYGQLSDVMSRLGVTFIPATDGVAFEV